MRCATAVMGGESGRRGFVRAQGRRRRVREREGREESGVGVGVAHGGVLPRAATGFLLPSLLPVMSMDLKLDDGEGAVLTTLFTVTYSLLLPFVGVLADTVNRKICSRAGRRRGRRRPS